MNITRGGEYTSNKFRCKIVILYFLLPTNFGGCYYALLKYYHPLVCVYTTEVSLLVCLLFLIIDSRPFIKLEQYMITSCYVLMNELPGTNFPGKSAALGLHSQFCTKQLKSSTNSDIQKYCIGVQ